MKQFLKKASQAATEIYHFIKEALGYHLIGWFIFFSCFFNGLLILYVMGELLNFVFGLMPINEVTKYLFVAILAFTAGTALIYICVFIEDLNFTILKELNKLQPTTKLGRKILKIIIKYW
jgi:hypothetical protein